ncbi:MAG: hypothetical protein V3U33_07480 [candidate division NC10 bacterium]
MRHQLEHHTIYFVERRDEFNSDIKYTHIEEVIVAAGCGQI